MNALQEGRWHPRREHLIDNDRVKVRAILDNDDGKEGTAHVEIRSDANLHLFFITESQL